ncbi:DUF4245 domain-containing protein [Segniliparus rugosus]|uniref:DUF4245 domain-containing protein n=1 Tax=Segniliparus rugosus (strain ATCC BAA-974 / DSM 45345 / CCUG 50838 / CIP 108380 / JCM 13579 / CDC 945) TaxID=679197 RepID=E5XMQ8_SEGRC|nr:DUF4245 domain-containing protein [Segniliparus rugosus]EFV14403.1 hypothetical protein HMPREF9336_00778 [Segniliparus rugosus ATCC BAA-974]
MSAEKKHRLLHDQRDMLLSLAPLVLVCLLIAGLAGKCSFSPTGFAGPANAVSEIKDVDARHSLEEAARFFPFPVRTPAAPDTWRTIAVDRGEIKTSNLPSEQISVNYLSPAGRAYRVTQTDATVPALLSWVALSDGEDKGAQDIGGARWTVTAQGPNSAWIWDDGRSRVALTATNGDETAFRLLAAAVAAAPVTRPDGK